ncbi:MAG: DUF4159 domain-containing protein [Candidatus Hydrogenedentes bacterium]|nr:DUF4159 domain-containing protein [Candidatus Hydrogenedentota bacterium]
MKRRRFSRRAFILTVAAGVESAQAAAQAISCGAPPPAKPHRIKGGESFAPLPLPVTPLRRTERKRPPAPPVLIAKLQYGKERTATAPDGRTYTYLDWKSDPADAAKLLQFAGPKLGIRYRHQLVGPDIETLDPRENPILYVTGHHRFEAPPGSHERIRDYVLAGGTVLGDACCGSPPFVEGFMEFIKQAFPQRRFAPLPADHGLYRAFYTTDEVTYQEGATVVKKAAPEIFGVEIGCRAGVLFTRHDLSCGWDGHVHDRGARIEPFDAMRLGTNLLSYMLANQELGRFLVASKSYYEKGGGAGDRFVLGQLIHDGDWDPDPSAVANLLKATETESSIDVRFVRHEIDAAKDNLYDAPFIYMTGHHDFAFREPEVVNLRDYLTNGGFLLADACCSRKAFDQAFRRELQRVFPDRPLEPIDPADPFFSCLHKIKNVRFTLRGEAAPPELLGIRVDGAYAVVYSPSDLGNGWEGVEHPFVDGIAQADSLEIGMNAIMYALTH